MRRVLLFVSLFALVASACSGAPDADPLVGNRASTDLAVGDERLLFGLHELDGTRRGGPDEIVTVVASPLDDADVEMTAQAEFVWIVPDAIGLYMAKIPFDIAGTWQIDMEVSTGEPTKPFLIDILEEPLAATVGEPAPSIATPTLSDRDIEDLTTDHDPLEVLYEMSLDTALANGRKTVVIFATPAYCVSAACGPMLDQMKTLSAEYPDVNFLHVEVYEGFNETGFEPNFSHLAPAVVAFGLPSEPWVYVTDEQGVVTGRFDGVLAPGEVEALLDA